MLGEQLASTQVRSHASLANDTGTVSPFLTHHNVEAIGIAAGSCAQGVKRLLIAKLQSIGDD